MIAYYTTNKHQSQHQVTEEQYIQWMLTSEYILKSSTTNDIIILTAFNGVVINPLLHQWYSTTIDGVIKNQYKSPQDAFRGHEAIVADYRKKLLAGTEGLQHYLIAEIHTTGRQLKFVIPLEKKILIEVDSYGTFKILSPENKCGICGGHGAQVYRYYEDEMKVSLCYVCNGGTKENWERERKNFDEFCRSLR